MALGFNHFLQIDLNPTLTVSVTRKLRENVKQPDTRAMLANFEGLFSYYEDFEFNSITPPPDMPAAMISIFDRLVNDPQYLQLSETVSSLSDPGHRRGALSRVRELWRAIIASNTNMIGWNYVAKLIKVWTGVPIPEADTLSILVSGRTLPTLVDLHIAREHALKMWMTSGKHDVPYSRSGTQLSKGKIDWLPPCTSMKASRSGDARLSLGRVGDLLELLSKLDRNRAASR